MSSKPETTFIQSVHKHLPKSVYRMKNNNQYVGGIFDVWYSANPRDLWVEYKFVVVPARPKTDILPNLSALQLEWGRGRAAEGRNLAVVVGCKEGGVIFTDFDWEHPITAEAFRATLLDRKTIAEYICNLTQGEL